MQPVYISGHRNPDTDTIGAAIGYAELRSKLDPETQYIPVRLGELNPQTRWVLAQAGREQPELLPHIHLRAVDVMQTAFSSVTESDPIRAAGLALARGDCDVVPVLTDRGALAGTVSCRALAHNCVEPGGKSLDAPSRELLEQDHVLAEPDDLLSEVADELRDSRHNAALVTDANGHVVGLVTLSDLDSSKRRHVILVDHAERAQSVPGIEDAEIVEILDHHHIGSIETRAPVRATFDPIGSTATLVTERFRASEIEPSRPVATLLLGAVLSDTVILKSPTTTDRDVAAASQLGQLLSLDPQEFGRRMFEETADVSGVSAAELVKRDAKGYKSSAGTPFLVAQIEVVGRTVLGREQELLDAMGAERAKQGVELYALMVTDILEQGTDLLVAGDAAAAARAFGVQLHDGHRLELPGVMSRKKQVAPPLLATL